MDKNSKFKAGRVNVFMIQNVVGEGKPKKKGLPLVRSCGSPEPWQD